MIIEKMRMEDLTQVITLHNSLVPFETSPENARENYRKMLENDDYYLAVAREDDKVLGTVTAICCHSLGVNFLVLEDLVVREDLRGGGVGTALVSAMEDFGREKSCVYVFLVSSGFRKRAHQFYEKQGFTEDVRGFRKAL